MVGYYNYFMEVFKERNIKWKNVYLKELFQDKTKAIDDVLRYEKNNPNHSDHVGRSRIVDDRILGELNNALKERNMSLKEVNQYFIEQGLNLTSKQTYGICKRIPNCTVGVRPLLEDKRCEITKEVIKQYCEEVKLLMKNKNIPSSFFYNLDESGFDEGVDTKPTVMICSNDSSHPKATPYSRESQRITFLGAICMDCTEVIPLLFITKRISLEEGLLINFYGKVIIEYQQSGFMNRSIFIKWFKKFIEFNNMKKILYNYKGTTVIIMDNFVVHHDDEIIELCKKNKIQILWLKPHTSHICQPLDLCIFGVQKRYLQNLINVIDTVDSNEISYDMVQSSQEQNFENTKRVLITKTKTQQTVEKRITDIYNSWQQACSLSNVISSFEQAGFFMKSVLKKKADITEMCIENGDISVSETIVPMVYFDPKHSREIRKMLFDEKQIKPIEMKRNLISIEGERSKEIRLNKENK